MLERKRHPVPSRANAGALMNRRATAFVIAAAARVGLGVASAQAGPCTSQIAQ